jgi:hypothetical protein
MFVWMNQRWPKGSKIVPPRREGPAPTGAVRKDSTSIALPPVPESEDCMRSWSRSLAWGCVVALTLGACGSSYKGLTKDEFIRRAVAICARTNVRLAKVGTAVGGNPTIEEVKDVYAKQLFPILEDQVDQLRRLKPPKEDRKQVSQIFDDLSKGIDQASAEIKSLKSTTELSSLATPPAMKAANTEATAYGLGSCADNTG